MMPPDMASPFLDAAAFAEAGQALQISRSR
jgi:hypothetical protein